ncbi:MAG: CPBP family glutamic-type intramembrane protease [Dehalococcoidales bacterium]|nr:CPBP family glutamic-type intramembrane protease [Dehalococcoidales bacterium]
MPQTQQIRAGFFDSGKDATYTAIVTQESGRSFNTGGSAVKAAGLISPLVPYITVSLGLLVFHNAWATLLGYHMGMLVILLIVRPGIPIRSLFRSTGWKVPLVTTAFGACGVLVYFLWPVFSISPDINLYLQEIGLNGSTWPFFLAYFIIVNPFFEEYYWRGYLGNSSKRLILNDLFFSGYHVIVLGGKAAIIWLIFAFLVLACAAWFWRQANRWGGGLWPSTVSHIAGDMTVLLAVFYMVQG